MHSFNVRQPGPGEEAEASWFGRGAQVVLWGPQLPTELRAGSRPRGLETKQARPGDMEDASSAPRICSTILCWEKAKLPRSWASQARTGHKFISTVTRNATWTWICTGSRNQFWVGDLLILPWTQLRATPAHAWNSLWEMSLETGELSEVLCTSTKKRLS